MNRFVLPLIAMALSSPAAAQGDALSDWSGVYFGAQGELFPSSEVSFSNAPSVVAELEGVHTGVFIGYRRQFNSIVVGGELDYVGGDTDLTSSTPGFAAVGTSTAMARVGAEVGYAAGRFLPYGTLGFARFTYRDTASGDVSSNGTFFGVGLDYQTGANTSLGVEILQQGFSDFDTIPTLNTDVTTIGVNFAIRY